MYSLVLMAAMTAGAPEAPNCWWHSRPAVGACWGCGGCGGGCAGCIGCMGCHGYSSGCRGCWGGNGCHGACYGCAGCHGCVGMGYAPGTRVGTIIYSPAASFPAYAGNEGIWAGTWSYSGTYPGQGPSYIPGATEKPKMKEASDSSARISIEVPEDAKLFIDGKLMSGTSTVRNYYTPALQPGQSYFYDVRIEMLKDGKTVAKEKKVIVQAGAIVKETFHQMKDSPAVASK